MSLTRLNLVLLGLVAVFGALVLRAAGPETTSEVSDKVFSAFDPAAILRVTVTNRKDPEATPLVLVRDSSEAEWKLPARAGYPAEAYPLEQLFARIANLRGRDQVAEASDSLELFGLGPGMGIGVELASPGGVPWRFVLGAPGGKAGGFLRAASESRMFAAPGFAGLSIEPRQWLAPKLFDFDASRISRVEIQLAGVELTLARDGKGLWRETETGFNAPRITLEDLIGDLSALVLTDLAGKQVDTTKAGFGASLPRVLLFDEAGEALAQLVIGGVDPSGLRFVQSGAWREAGHSEWIGLVTAPQAESIMQRVSTVIAALGGGSQ